MVFIAKLKQVIKSEEFPYQNNIALLENKWFKKRTGNIWVSLHELHKNMKAPTVHYEDDSRKSVKHCPQNCSQKRKCLRIRQTGKLVKDVVQARV